MPDNDAAAPAQGTEKKHRFVSRSAVVYAGRAWKVRVAKGLYEELDRVVANMVNNLFGTTKDKKVAEVADLKKLLGQA